MLFSVGGLRKIFFTQNPLTESPIPFGHILLVYGSDELSSVPPWSVRLGPIEMAVTATFLYRDLPFFFIWLEIETELCYRELSCGSGLGR